MIAGRQRETLRGNSGRSLRAPPRSPSGSRRTTSRSPRRSGPRRFSARSSKACGEPPRHHHARHRPEVHGSPRARLSRLRGGGSEPVALSERDRHAPFGVFMLFCCFEVAAFLAMMVLGSWLFNTLHPWAILGGNLVAALTMLGIPLPPSSFLALHSGVDVWAIGNAQRATAALLAWLAGAWVIVLQSQYSPFSS